MSDFLNFIHKEQKKKLTEEERLALHKKQKLYEAQYSADELEEEDDFYDEDEQLVEAHRVPKNPQRRPMPAPVPSTPVPQEPVYDEPYVEPEPIPAPVPPTRRRRTNVQVAEAYRPTMNPVLTEAYELIDEMKNKMETMFFKYGMTGLARLNECMLDVCDEIMNPPVAKPAVKPSPVYNDLDFDNEEPVISEKVLSTKKKPVAVKQPVRKPVNKKPVAAVKPVAKPVVATSKPKHVKTEEEMLKEKAEKMNAMFENADLSELGNTLVMQSDVQENRGAQRKAEIEARGKALEEKMTKKPKQQQETTIENDEPVEELEVVPDGATTLEVEEFDENTSLETAVLDNPA